MVADDGNTTGAEARLDARGGGSSRVITQRVSGPSTPRVSGRQASRMPSHDARCASPVTRISGPSVPRGGTRGGSSAANVVPRVAVKTKANPASNIMRCIPLLLYPTRRSRRDRPHLLAGRNSLELFDPGFSGQDIKKAKTVPFANEKGNPPQMALRATRCGHGPPRGAGCGSREYLRHPGKIFLAGKFFRFPVLFFGSTRQMPIT
jgi:hypothetical protein